MRRILFSLAFGTALLGFAASEASAFSFLCEAVGVRSRAWGRSYYVAVAGPTGERVFSEAFSV